jgi:hypothetical protein
MVNMDLSTFQLVDAINDMDMLRNLSGQQEYQQRSQPQHTPSTSAAYPHLQGDNMALFFPSDQNHMNSFLSYKNSNANQIMPSPHYRPTSVPQNDCFEHHQEVYTSKKNNMKSMYHLYSLLPLSSNYLILGYFYSSYITSYDSIVYLSSPTAATAATAS